MKCKHDWHFVREMYVDGWDSLCSSKKVERGNYAKFICSECGLVRFVKEKKDGNI